MLLQIRYSSSCVVGDIFLRELQELVDEDERRTRPLEVLHGDKVTGSIDGRQPRPLDAAWAAAHLKNLHEGQQAVLKRPLVVAEEDERLEQLKDGEHVAEEGHMVLLPELVHVEVDAAVKEACDHGQVSGETWTLSALDSRSTS